MTPAVSTPTMLSRFIAAAAVLSVILIAAACSGSPSDATVPEPSPSPDRVEPIDEPVSEDDDQTAPDAPEIATEKDESSPRPDQVELIEGQFSDDGIQVILGTPDVAVGTHRMAFVLNAKESPVRAPFATVVSRHVPEDGSESGDETALAVFRPWPYGTRGSYTTSLTFDVAGTWQLDVTVLGEDGESRTAQLSFPVAEETEAPDVGAPALRSQNKTLDDVDDLAKLTTGSIRDPDLYGTTIADAVGSGIPTVIVVASPAFCINAVCGPQVEVLQQLKDKYKGQANFIHVDFYDNPDEIQGDLSRARISPIVFEWRLLGVEWSFVIDQDGKISARFESFATFDELDEALRRIL